MEGYLVAQSSELVMKRPGELQFHYSFVRGYHAYNDGWSLVQHELACQHETGNVATRPTFAVKVVKSLAIASSTSLIVRYTCC